MKAFLYHVNEASWRHSIRELLQRYFMRVGSQVDERLLTLARELDRHYITSRYPNALPSGTPHEVYDEEVSNRVIRAAEELIGFVRREVGV